MSDQNIEAPTIGRRVKEIRSEDLMVKEVSKFRAICQALVNPRGLYKFKMHKDQFVVVKILSGLNEGKNNPDLLFVNNAIGGKAVFIATSLDAIRYLASQENLDKGTKNVALMLSGSYVADGVMGNADEYYVAMERVIKDYITEADKNLKDHPEIVSNVMSPGSELYNSFLESYTSEKMNELTAFLILDIIFPNSDWSLKNVQKFMKPYSLVIEKSNDLFFRTKLSVPDEETMEEINDVSSRLNAIFDPLFEQEIKSQQQGSQEVGLYTALRSKLEEVTEEDKPDRENFIEKTIKVTISNVLAASYETISSALDEFLYVVSKNKIIPSKDLLEFMKKEHNGVKYKRKEYGKALWDYINYLDEELKKNPSNKELRAKHKTLITNIIYEIVRIRTPLSLAIREAVYGDIEIGDVTIPQGSLILYSQATATHNSKLFPKPDHLRLDLTVEQKEGCRSAWSVNPMLSKVEEVFDRFCKGFNYSITAMQLIIHILTGIFDSPILVEDADMGMSGTTNRKGSESKFEERKKRKN